jgi:hypothetical protein
MSPTIAEITAWALQYTPSAQDIIRLHRAMIPLAEPMPEPLHFWLPGLYIRVLTLRAGSTVVGKIHRHDHHLCVVSGHAEVADGFERFEVRAGYSGLSRAGAKRAVHCYEDTTFLTVHKNPTNTRDLAAIEAEHIAPEDAETQALAREHNQGVPHDVGSRRSSGNLACDEHRGRLPRPEAAAQGADGPTTG